MITFLTITIILTNGFWILVARCHGENFEKIYKRDLDISTRVHKLERLMKNKQDKPSINIGGKHEFGHDYD